MTHEKEFSDLQKCGHCGNTAPMEIGTRFSQVREYTEDSGQFEVAWQHGNIYELLVCPACKAVTLRQYYWHDSFLDEPPQYEVLYPSAPRELVGLPQVVARAYEAALRVRGVDANAYGVLIGRVLELVAEDRDAKGRSLHHKLLDLSRKGEIPAKLVGVAKNLKDLRNVGAHALMGELTSAEIPILDDLARSILEYVYSAPFIAARAEERLRELQGRQQRSPKGRPAPSSGNA